MGDGPLIGSCAPCVPTPLDPVILDSGWGVHPGCEPRPRVVKLPTRAELQRRSHHAVRTAIRNGKIIVPERCEMCGGDGPLDAHHPDGDYAPKNQLVVTFTCSLCQ